jgi:hypothetical protein
MDVLAWLLFIALIVAAVLIYMRVAKPDIWNRWKIRNTCLTKAW